MSLAPSLTFPYAAPPPFGTLVPIAEGILWLRLPLPFGLDHVNVYLLEDRGGWALLDTGLGDDRTREIWSRVLDTALGGKPITRLLCSHFHPDHVGLAGWLAERFGMPLYMAQSEYLYCRILRTERGEGSPAEQTPFYTSAGLEPARIAEVLGRGQNYLLQTTGLPSGFERLGAGQDLAFGGRDWRVLTGGGHSPEQVMLAGQGLFFAADQVLARISPNISVVPMMPNDDPLSVYLDSLAVLAKTVPDGVLVLPCHNLPFRGLHARLASLAAHHRQRCDVISLAAKAKALTAAEILTAMFPRPLDPHQYRFAIGETLAHVNHMLGCGRLVAEGDAVRRYRSA